MKKTFLAFATVVLFGLAGCGDDESSTPSTPSDPSIEVTPGLPPGSFGVEAEIDFVILLTTDPSVGIASLVISNNGKELVSQTNFGGGNIFTFNYTYTTTWEDAQNGRALFTLTVTDGAGQTATTEATINVNVEYNYFNDNLIPIPGWNLVDNDVANPADDSTLVDLGRETLFGGDNNYFSLSTTEYYPLSGSLDFLDANLTTAQIEAAISGSTPVSSIIDSNGSAFPFVAKLRGTNEYALISQIDTTFNPVRLGYRKTSASAGQ